MHKHYLFLITPVLAAASAYADVSGITNKGESQTPTAEDYKTAKSVLPTVDSPPLPAVDNNVPQTPPAEMGGNAGHAPRVKYKGKAEKLYESTPPQQETPAILETDH